MLNVQHLTLVRTDYSFNTVTFNADKVAARNIRKKPFHRAYDKNVNIKVYNQKIRIQVEWGERSTWWTLAHSTLICMRGGGKCVPQVVFLRTGKNKFLPKFVNILGKLWKTEFSLNTTNIVIFYFQEHSNIGNI